MPDRQDLAPIVVGCRAVRAGAHLPQRMSRGASGFDVHACLEAPVELAPGQWRAIPTGLALEIPAGWEVQVRARSGLALRSAVGLVNGVGTIDSDYRGELRILLMNWGCDPLRIQGGDRIAQLVVQRVPDVRIEWSESLGVTERGEGGFGSTGTRPAERESERPE